MKNQNLHLLFKIVLFLILNSQFSILNSFAQSPINDNCANASLITISNGGFDTTVFYSDTIDLTNATNQSGEVFAAAHQNAGTDKKTVWYKFSLPTSRAIRLELKQPPPDTAIAVNGAGFTLFKTNSCIPKISDVAPAKLTPLTQFGSTSNPCLDAGDYYIQVSAKNNSFGKIFIALGVSFPNGKIVSNTNFDKILSDKSDVYDFGTISGGWVSKLYDVGCQTIDNAAEICAKLGKDY